MPLRQQVIAAFPATGKTYYASRHSGVADSDSSSFSPLPEWPENYIAHIRDLLEEGATVLVSTHAEVRQALAAREIPFLLVYPDEGCRVEYVKRMRERGSPERLIAAVAMNWRRWISDCRLQHGCDHHVLTNGEYLSDALEVEKAA